MALELDLKEKNIILFGGESNIGRYVTWRFAMEGAGLTITYHSREAAAKEIAAKALEYGAAWADVIQCNASEYENVGEVIKSAQKHGDINCVYNGVASNDFGFFEVDNSRWEQLWRCNLLVALNIWHQVLPIMREQKHGNCVFVASTMGRMHWPHEPVYGAFKAAIIHLGQTFAQMVGKDGVRINFVAPGPTPPVDLETSDDLGEMWTRIRNGDDFDWVKDNWRNLSCLDDVSTPEDVANAVAFLASEVTARHITGDIMGVDGGCYMPK